MTQSIDFPEIKQAKLLIIDDDPAILQAIKSSLHLPGIKLKIEVADSGLVGLQKAKQFLPDIIVLDLQMPDLDGFEVLAELREDHQLAHTRVIMLTAQDTIKNLWEAVDRKLDDFMSKPFDLTELEARIYNQLLDRTR